MTKLEHACFISWRKGYKPEKALLWMSSVLDYTPTYEDYKQTSRKVILSKLHTVANKEK